MNDNASSIISKVWSFCFWLRDKSLADLDNLPDPDVLANDIIENLEAAVESFKEIGQRI